MYDQIADTNEAFPAEYLTSLEDEQRESSSFTLESPAVQITRGRRKLSMREPEKGKHIDTVYPQQTVDEIEAIVAKENIPTVSTLMRKGIAFYLVFRKIAKPTDLVVVYTEKGEVRFRMPIEAIV